MIPQTFKRFFIACAVLFLFAVFTLLTFTLGALHGELGAKDRRFTEEKAHISPVLSSNPSYSKIEIVMFTGDGSAYLSGTVSTTDELQKLHRELLELFGEVRINELIRAVSVDSPPLAAAATM